MECAAPGQYKCVAGPCVCLRAGCDGRGGSGKVIDKCGDCGGDSQRCRPAVVGGQLFLSPLTLADYNAAASDVLSALVALLGQASIVADNITVTAREHTPETTNVTGVLLTYEARTTKEHGTAARDRVAGLNAAGRAQPFRAKGGVLANVDVTETEAASVTLTDETESGGLSTMTIIIIAAAGGGGLLLILLLVCCCCCCRRQRRSGAGCCACCSKEHRRRSKQWKTVMRESKRGSRKSLTSTDSTKFDGLDGSPMTVFTSSSRLGDKSLTGLTHLASTHSLTSVNSRATTDTVLTIQRDDPWSGMTIGGGPDESSSDNNNNGGGDRPTLDLGGMNSWSESDQVGTIRPQGFRTSNSVVSNPIFNDSDAPSDLTSAGSARRSEEDRRRAAEAKARALELAKQQDTREKTHPREWIGIEVITWLKHHGFKDFIDTFYSNGFEGAQLVQLQVESFAGIRALSRERCQELITAIAALKRQGWWLPPLDETDEDDAGLSEQAASPPLLPGMVPGPSEPAAAVAAPPPPRVPSAGASRAGEPVCEVCQLFPASVRCDGLCNKSICAGCSDYLHNGLPDVSRQRHRLSSISASSSAAAGSARVAGGAGSTATLFSKPKPAPAPPASTAASGTRTVAMAYALEGDTEEIETARMQYFLSQRLGRDDAAKLLHNGNCANGEYLVRKSTRETDMYVLSLVYNRKVQHFKVQYRPATGQFVTNTGLKFDNLALLVAHFKRIEGGGLPCKLTHSSRHYDHLITLPDATSAAPPRPADEDTSFGFGFHADTPEMGRAVPGDDRRPSNASGSSLGRPRRPYENQQIVDQHARTESVRSNPGETSDGTYGNQPAINAFFGLPDNSLDAEAVVDDVDALLGEIDVRVQSPQSQPDDTDFGFGDMGNSPGMSTSALLPHVDLPPSQPRMPQHESEYEMNITFDTRPVSDRQPIQTDTTYTQVDPNATQALHKALQGRRSNSAH